MVNLHRSALFRPTDLEQTNPKLFDKSSRRTTYRHLCHGIYLGLGRALELLWTLNDQLLFGSFARPSLHFQQQLRDTVKLEAKGKQAANMSGEEKSREKLRLEKFEAWSVVPALLERSACVRARDARPV